METKKIEETVMVAPNGTILSIMERPGGIGSIEDYIQEVEDMRRKYGHLMNKQSLDEYFAERHAEAERE